MGLSVSNLAAYMAQQVYPYYQQKTEEEKKRANRVVYLGLGGAAIGAVAGFVYAGKANKSKVVSSLLGLAAGGLLTMLVANMIVKK